MNKFFKLVLTAILSLSFLVPTLQASELTLVKPKLPSVNQLKQAQAQLNQAQAKWRKTQPQHYSFSLQRSCFCPPEYNKPILIRVFKGKVQQASLMPEGKPLPVERKAEAYPIEGAFKIIQEAIKRRAASITVNYNKQYGYPTTISIDYSTMIADEETYISIKDFKVASGLKPIQPK